MIASMYQNINMVRHVLFGQLTIFRARVQRSREPGEGIFYGSAGYSIEMFDISYIEVEVLDITSNISIYVNIELPIFVSYVLFRQRSLLG